MLRKAYSAIWEAFRYQGLGIAAYFSKAKGKSSVEVDYLFARGVKKVSGAKPGFVVYHNNWSAFVTPNEDRIRAMRIK